MKRMNRTILALVASVVMVGALAVLGCGGDDDDDFEACDVNNVNGFQFVFGESTVFSVGGGAFTLTFLNNGTRFTLLKTGDGTATGTVSFNPFSFNVLTNNIGALVQLGSCTLDLVNNTISITNLSGVSATSSPGTATGSTGTGGS